jgi:hypothetical protein
MAVVAVTRAGRGASHAVAAATDAPATPAAAPLTEVISRSYLLDITPAEGDCRRRPA